jgi:hypothetical protein
LDCWGVAQPAVRYDSPTWGGFRFETSYGTNAATGPFFNANDSDFWDIAVFYTGDWNSIKLSAAAAYTWIETGINTGTETDLFQVGASIYHKPSGLGIFGQYQTEESGGFWDSPLGFDRTVSTTTGSCTTPGSVFPCNPPAFGPDAFSFTATFDEFFRQNNPDTDAWYVKPFWRKTWSPIGATVLYGEWGQYNDQFAAGQNLCLTGLGGATTLANFCGSITSTGIGEGVFVTGSEVERWGLGLVQEIDSAAMHLWIRWQHQEIDLDLVGYEASYSLNPDCANGCKLKQSFDDWDLIQVGGIIFF